MTNLFTRCATAGAIAAIALAGAGVATATAASAAPLPSHGIIAANGAGGTVTVYNKTDEPIEISFYEQGQNDLTILAPNDSFSHIEHAGDHMIVRHVGGGDSIVDATFYGGQGWTGTSKFGVSSKVQATATTFVVRIPAIR